jgi:hypothetical protein
MTKMPDERTEAKALMQAFLARTAIPPHTGTPRRYLWTDAFALINALQLMREGHAEAASDARALVGQVHRILGSHREDDPRTGPLSDGADGAAHPTAGGLRIGKPRAERGPHERFDERAEWDRDGQYFHYLTKWMDALVRASVTLDEPEYLRQAVALAEGVVPRFVLREPSGRPRGVAWKMSIDLSRPLVPATSPHDALDGYVTLREIETQAGGDGPPVLAETLRDLTEGHRWLTADPLGLGGLLLDAARLLVCCEPSDWDQRLAVEVLTDVGAGLRHYLADDPLEQPVRTRLAFRELGLAVGLQTLPAMSAACGKAPGLSSALEPPLEQLSVHAPLAKRIAAFWSTEEHRRDPLFAEHRDINEVMLATALLGAYADTLPSPPP